MQSNSKPAKLEIGVLYGFRALMVLFVANFHLWQQSWIGQYIPWLGRIISFDFWTRSSYLFVDGMILLSGFLLYLPHARRQLEHTPVPSAGTFYFRRLVRILPSYTAAVLLALVCIAIPQGLYPSAGQMAHDVAAHMTFTFLFWPETYLTTPLNVALWTIAVEMQFYLVFPLLARAMKKRPVLTLALMALVAWGYRFCASAFEQELPMLINQLPAFLDVYALGFAGAMVYCRLRLWLQKAERLPRAAMELAAMAAFALGICALLTILRTQSAASTRGYTALHLSQMQVRLPLALTLLALMLSACFWPRILQKLLDNRLMRFLSTISFNLYIWHQVLAVEMRKAWFPNADLLHTDKAQQSAYMLLCISVAILAAMAMTYGLEQPVSRLAETIRNRYRRKHSHERSQTGRPQPSADPVFLCPQARRTRADREHRR